MSKLPNCLAHLEEKIPGCPFKESITRPESSDLVINFDLLQKKLAFNSECLIGNSSVGIRECAYLGIPVVNIGDRQKNRLRAENVIDVGCTFKTGIF